MISEDDIALQKFSNYHSAFLLLLLSWVIIPPWLSINYSTISSLLSNPPSQTVIIGAILLIGLYTLSLVVIWNRCIETESALRSRCGCTTPPATSQIPPNTP